VHSASLQAESKFVEWRHASSRDSPAHFKFKVEPGDDSKKLVTGSLQLSDHKDWIEIFRLQVDHFQSPNFLGFSAFTGSKGSQKPTELYLHSLQVKNFDSSAVGEDVGAAELGTNWKEWLNMLEDEKRYMSQKSQTEALGKLTDMLNQHNKRFHVMGQRLHNSLVTVDTKIHALEEKAMVLKKEVQLTGMGGKEPPLDVLEMKHNIKGLKHIFSEDTHRHKEHLKKVHAKIKTVQHGHHKEADHHARLAFVATKAESLQRHAEAAHAQHNWMMLIVFIVVIAIGYLIFNRMKYYEKKHFL